MSYPPVFITDTKYRASLAAVEALGQAGYPVYAVHTAKDLSAPPPAFFSKYTKEAITLPCSFSSKEYPGLLLEALDSAAQKEGELPVLFPIGAVTLSRISQNYEEFSHHAHFLVSSPETLELANDKRKVSLLAKSLSLPLPLEYPCQSGALPPRFPVVIKPRCGEKLGLHPEERYRKVFSEEKFSEGYGEMSRYDPEPVVQELLEGEGVGVSVMMDQKSRPVSILCHRRVREYPIAGGPSACCESFWDEALVQYAVRLLSAMSFVGIAMAEFKGGKLLEINPRIWGSFPLTYKCGSPFSSCYVRAALGEELPMCQAPSYREGVRTRFLLNDTLSALSYLRHGKIGKTLGAVKDFFSPRCKEALFSFDDPKPFAIYLKNTLTRKGE